MAIKESKPSDYGIVRYFQSVESEFKKFGLTVNATLNDFQVNDENGKVIFSCATIAGVDGFYRGLLFATKK